MVDTIKVLIPHETVNDETVRILSWKVASGSRVEKDQILCEVETSKALVEIHAPDAGLVRYAAAVGDEVMVGSIICEIFPEMQSAPEVVLIPWTAASQAVVAELPPARFTSLAQKIAADYGIDKTAFPPGTLVRSSDVLLKAGKSVPQVERGPGPSSPKPGSRPSSEDDASSNPPVAGVAVDWTELPRKKTVESRILRAGQAATIQSSVTLICRAAGLRARVDKLGFSAIGMSALMVFELARLLRKYPMFNALFAQGRKGQYREVNIGWAIDGGQGLVVPVIKHADQKSLGEIARTMEQHLEAYLGNSMTPDDFLGGTFTVSDLSGQGISLFQPLISQGQSAILGVGSEMIRESGESLYLTLAFDHQVAEGRSAAQLLQELAGRLEVHASLERTAHSERFCVLCQRDEDALKKYKAILLTSEIPPGSVCSICLAGW